MEEYRTGKEFCSLIHALSADLLRFELDHIREESEEDVTLHEIHTIELIGHLKEGTMSELSRKSRVKQSTMTVMIDKLIRKGLVDRYRMDDDRRVVRVRLTGKGELLHREHDKRHQIVTDQWLRPLSEKEQETLLVLLRRITEKMDD